MENIGEKLDNINNSLEGIEKLNKTLEGILKTLSTPESRFMTFLKYVGAVVGALSFLGIVEIVRQWITGG